MRKTRAVAITALVAASAMVFAACGNTNQAESTTSGSQAAGTGSSAAPGTASSAAGSDTASSSAGSETAASGSSGASGSGSAASGSSSSGTASSGTATAGGEDGCGKPHGPYQAPAAKPGSSVKVAWNQVFYSYNAATGHGNAVANANPLYLMNAQSFYYDDKLALINNDSFMTCTLVSKDPLTIKYTINKAAKWSDGVPVSAADLLLTWAAIGGQFGDKNTLIDPDGNAVLPATDDATRPKVVDSANKEVTGKDYDGAFDADSGALKKGFSYVKSSGIKFDASSDAMSLVKEFPEIGDDNQSLTIKYSEFFVDYPFQLAVGVPAHVVAMKALGESDAAKATDDMVAAFKAYHADKNPDSAKRADADKVKKIADFWNTGFDYSELPSDKALYLSSGAYLLKDFKKDQYMTFVKNPDYTWGPIPQVETITYRIIGDATAQVQALQNGEVDLIQPQSTPDVLQSVQALAGQGVKVETGDGATYEHVDLAQNNKGPFDPKSYGGDKDKALKVRQAFLKTIPRDEIIARLIKPLNPNAEVRNSFNVVPGSPAYADTVAQNGSDAYKSVDIEGAKKLLAEAGVPNPTVRFMYADNNPRRANEYKLIAASASQAGFKLVDGKNINWGNDLQNTKIYDAVLFGWQSSAVGASQIAPNFRTGAQNNFYGYSNKEVDDLLTKLNAEPDVAKQNALNIEIEKKLWADAFGTVIFQFPDVTAFNSNKIQNASSIPLLPTIFWNYWEWTTP